MKMIETKELKLEDLFPAAYNNRKAWSKDQMVELVASVKQRGVLVPLIVREGNQAGKGNPQAGKFEIVCGARRFNAATEAGLKLVPCSIRQMTDEEAYELMIIENLQRENIHPLDESAAFVLLSKTNTADQIASKIHKHKSYVIKRIKLANLVPEGQKLFYEGGMNYSQALILSRLQEKDQSKAIRENMNELHEGGKTSRFLNHEKKLLCYIRQHFMLTMDKAVFDLEDADLVKAAGSCSLCPKRTKNSPNLFDDMNKDDRCTDPQCFNLKTQRHIELQAEQLKEKTGAAHIAKQDPWSSKVEIKGKMVMPVSKKDYPDAVPVVVSGSKDSYGRDVKPGTVLYVRPDLKDPAPPKLSKAEQEQSAKQRDIKKKDEAVRAKCLSFSIHLFEVLFNKANKGTEMKPSKKFMAQMWESLTEGYRAYGDNILFAVSVLEGFKFKDGYLRMPEPGVSMEDSFCQAIGKKKNNYMAQPKADAAEKELLKQAYLKLADLPAINALILHYVSKWSDHNMSIDAKSEFAQALAEFKIDVKAEKEKFSKLYDARLKDKQSDKAVGKAIKALLKPTGEKPAAKKAAVKTTAKKPAAKKVILTGNGRLPKKKAAVK